MDVGKRRRHQRLGLKTTKMEPRPVSVNAAHPAKASHLTPLSWLFFPLKSRVGKDGAFTEATPGPTDQIGGQTGATERIFPSHLNAQMAACHPKARWALAPEPAMYAFACTHTHRPIPALPCMAGTTEVAPALLRSSLSSLANSFVRVRGIASGRLLSFPESSPDRQHFSSEVLACWRRPRPTAS